MPTLTHLRPNAAGCAWPAASSMTVGPLRRAAERLQVSPTTAKRWADRYRTEGLTGMADRSSRPHHSPTRTPAPVARKVLHPRAKRRCGPARIAGRLGLPASTCHAALTRAGVARLAHLDRTMTRAWLAGPSVRDLPTARGAPVEGGARVGTPGTGDPMCRPAGSVRAGAPPA